MTTPAFIRNCWYVAGWAHELDKGQLLAITIAGTPVVVYRLADGRLAALEDRCAHRGAPLSLGRLEGDELRCLYHGMKFAADGRCTQIPGQERIPPQACVRRFAVAEAHSWIWVWMGDADEADGSLIPPAFAIGTRGTIARTGHIDYANHYELINDNLLDFSHLGYVHAASFGSSEQWAHERPQVTRLERGVNIQRWMPDQPGSYPVPRTRRVDNYLRYDYLLPGVLIMTSYQMPLGTAARLAPGVPDESNAELLRMHLSCQALTPMTDGTTRYFYSVAMPPDADGGSTAVDRFFEVTERAFAEDKVMIEAQERNLRLDPSRGFVPTTSDAALNHFRAVIRKQIEAEANTRARAPQESLNAAFHLQSRKAGQAP